MPTETVTSSAGARVTRLAPSPTGALHLGNARTFLVNWALARRNGWRVILRLEDLDGPRVKPGACEGAIEDLAWLGLTWEGEPRYQRADLAPYEAALAKLRERELIYPCTCRRQEIALAQSAPNKGDRHDLRYPGTCRGRSPSATMADEPQAWRVIAPPRPVEFSDEVLGPRRIDVDAQVGDFVVATKAGLPAYQLAVVVDDAREGVTDVVRGEDLVDSTGRQLWLYELLGLRPTPRYWHLPLVLGPDGRRLAKRHGDTRVAWYRERGVTREKIVGLLASWSGVEGERRPMSAEEFASRFDPSRLPRSPITFSAEDHRWLVA